jgi:hypothetical protein
MEADLLTGPLADRLLRVCARHKITSLTCKAYLISTAQLPQSTHLPPNLPSNQSNHKIKDVCRSLQYAKIDWDLKDLDNMPDLNEIVSNVPRILGNHFPRLHNVDMRNVGRGFLGELCQYMHQYMPSTSSLCIEMDSKSLDPDLEWNGFKTLISSQLTSLSLKATVSIPITYIMTDCISSLSAALLTPECQLQTLCLDMRGSILEDHENLGIFSLMLAGTRTLEHLNLTEGSLGLVTTVKALTRGLQHNSTLRKLVLCLQRQDGVDNHDDDDDELCPSYQDLVSVIAKHPRLEKVELRKIFDLSGLQWCVLIWQLIQQCPRVSSLVIRKRSQVNPQIVHPQLIKFVPLILFVYFFHRSHQLLTPTHTNNTYFSLLTSALSNTNCNLLDFGGIQLTQLPIIKSNHPLVDAIRKRGSLCCFATQTKNPALDHVIAQNLVKKTKLRITFN